ncbi:MAG: DUF4238 domain-containing protein, partial [Casimicrobiaceae bacterium]
MTKKQRQHWVPESYLKSWCTPAAPGFVYLYTRTGNLLGRKRPRGLFFEFDMYTKFGPGGKRDLGLERGHERLETEFGQIKNEIEAMKVLDKKSTGWLIGFICALHARTPKVREHDRRQWGNVLRVALDVERGMQEVPPETRSRMAAARIGLPSKKPSLSIAQVESIMEGPLQTLLLPRLIAAMRVIGELNMKVAVFCTTMDHPFITSDAPCIWYDSASEFEINETMGVGSPTFEINVPISPTRFLVLSKAEEVTGYVP